MTYWTVTDIDLGTLPTDTNRTVTYNLPGQIPANATDILVYAFIRTGASNSDIDRQFKIFVQSEGSEIGGMFYLFAHGYSQSAWSYNSENFWLPMPLDRDLLVQMEGPAFNGNHATDLRIIGYKS